MDPASRHAVDLISHALFGIWLEKGLQHKISTDELLYRADDCHFPQENLLELITMIRRWFKEFPDSYTMEIVFPQPGNLGSLPIELSTLAFESELTILFHPPQNPTESHYQNIAGCELQSLALLTHHPQENSLWFIKNFIRTDDLLEPLNPREITHKLSHLQNNLVSSWHAQPQILPNSLKGLTNEIQTYLKEISVLPLPSDIDCYTREAMQRINHTQAIILAIRHWAHIISPECEHHLTQLEKFYYPAVAAILNSALSQHSLR